MISVPIHTTVANASLDEMEVALVSRLWDESNCKACDRCPQCTAVRVESVGLYFCTVSVPFNVAEGHGAFLRLDGLEPDDLEDLTAS